MPNSEHYLNADRLSDLPDDVLHLIVLRLDLREQVATSLLSRRWRGLWSRNPTLRFNPGAVARHDDGRFIDECISRWQQLPRRFHLDLAEHPVLVSPPRSSFRAIEAFANVLEEVVIGVPRYFWTPPRGVEFGRPFFPRLTTLTLVGCDVQSLLPAFQGLPALVSLHLEPRKISPSDLTDLLAACPVLENLTMVNFFRSGSMTVSSVTLKTLKMNVEMSTNPLSMNRVLLKDLPKLQRLDAFNLGAWKLSVDGELPSLQEANICSTFHHEARRYWLVPRFRSPLNSPDGPLVPTLSVKYTAFVSQLTNARVLQVDLEIAEVLTRYLISSGGRTQPAMFNQLKELHLHGSYNIGFKLISLQIFLGKCISLEELCIKLEPPVREFNRDIKPQAHMIGNEREEALESTNVCSLRHLKSARIIGLTGSRNEINLVKFILERARTIRSLTLYFRSPSFDVHNDEDIPVNFEEEINECLGASPYVHLLIAKEPLPRRLLCPKHFEHFGYQSRCLEVLD